MPIVGDEPSPVKFSSLGCDEVALATLSTISAMKRTALFSIIVVVITALSGMWIFRYIQHRQMAMALLALHHDLAVNNYHATQTPLPKLLTNQGNLRGSSASILGAYVDYNFQEDGVEWTRRYHILRSNTNSTTWVLYEFVEPNDMNLVQMARKHKLITVTGGL